MKQNPRLLLVLLSMGSSIDSTWWETVILPFYPAIHVTAKSFQQVIFVNLKLFRLEYDNIDLTTNRVNVLCTDGTWDFSLGKE